MTLAIQSFDVIAPLKSLWQWLVVQPGHTTARVAHHPRMPVPTAPNSTRCRQPVLHPVFIHQAITPPAPLRSHQPLRVVRVMEAGQRASLAGRMVISGRMADVCAELDRLAAFEAQLH
ncbi:hypothetical protein [Rhodoferax sp.]|uniref:hypothetical protein n=1 Tax=Rhodoferax sp. TaxID=50421 RepID=UPI00260EC055|nr:hypothetical protein [Rhodoferax sp.]MDD5478113.1 hypothetical protein [Rhodoferax sp.]